MATADRQTESSIDSIAMDAIDCFTDGIDGVVYELAERSATLRGRTPDGIVITVEDIPEATTTLVAAINSSDILDEVKDSIAEILDFCSRKIQEIKRS